GGGLDSPRRGQGWGAGYVIERRSGQEGRWAVHRAKAVSAILDEQAFDAPAESCLQLAPGPALQQVAFRLLEQKPVPGLRAQGVAVGDGRCGFRQTRAGPPARIARPGGSSTWRPG